MASITFGGLASGLDTDSIISALMDIEKKPLTRLENDKSYLNSRLAAFSKFNDKLKALESAFESLDTTDEFRSYSATAASEEFFTVDANSSAKAGAYNIEVVRLARVQKTASTGYASSTSTFSAGTININSSAITVETGDTLAGIVDKINAANTGDTATGVSATLINDGTTNGYRIMLSGKDAGTAFTATASGVTAEGLALNFSNTTQTAQTAMVNVDGLPIVSNNNTLKGAIAGVDLTLLKSNTAGVSTSLNVAVDTDGVKAKLDAFVSAYNDIVTFIADQKDTSWANDSSMQAVKRRLQNMLVENVGGTGNLHRLAEIGIKTNKDDGTISLDSTKITKLISTDFQSLEKLFLGEDGVEGINEKFINYLGGQTDSVSGFYVSRKKSTESAIKGIDRNIDNMKLRLEKREASMRAQFEALETMMSSLNATSNYLTQQISSLNSSK